MHILLLPSWYPKDANDVGGVFFRDQALALRKYGHDVGVIAPRMRSLRTLVKPTAQEKILTFENDDGVKTYRLNIYGALPRIPYGNYYLFKKAARFLFNRYTAEYGKPDILHAHSAVFGGAAGAELSREFDIPLVLTEHSSGFARGVYANWQLKLAENAIRVANVCIAVSPSLVDFLSKQFSFSKGAWAWVPNVVADRFNEPDDKRRLERPIRFLNLALMTENKGQLDLIEAFKIVVDSDPSAELLLGGDGPIRPALKEKANSFGIAGNVNFLGMVPPANVPYLLGEIDIVVISSHYETFGVVAAEALMAGVPVVATRCGGPQCIVEQGDGFLVAVGNPQELGSAMKILSKNIEDYNPAAISSRARSRFSGEAIASSLTKKYEKAIASRKGEP